VFALSQRKQLVRRYFISHITKSTCQKSADTTGTTEDSPETVTEAEPEVVEISEVE